MKRPRFSATEPVPWVDASRTIRSKVVVGEAKVETRQLVTVHLRGARTTTKSAIVCQLTRRSRAVMKDNRARPPRCNRLSSWKMPASRVLKKKAAREAPSSKCQHLVHPVSSIRCDKRALEAGAPEAEAGKAGSRRQRTLPRLAPLPQERSFSSFNKRVRKTRRKEGRQV